MHGGYVYNARFVVQSNDRSPRYLDERVEAFLVSFREVKSRPNRLIAEAYSGSPENFDGGLCWEGARKASKLQEIFHAIVAAVSD